MLDAHKVLVCSACLTTSCWHHEFVCDKAAIGNVVEMTVGELRALNREHPDNWSARKMAEVYGAGSEQHIRALAAEKSQEEGRCEVTRRKSRVAKDDTVVTAWAEPAAGPGWSNMPVWVLIKDGRGRLRVECLQPNEQTQGMRLMYAMGAATHLAMRAEAIEALSGKGGDRD